MAVKLNDINMNGSETTGKRNSQIPEGLRREINNTILPRRSIIVVIALDTFSGNIGTDLISLIPFENSDGTSAVRLGSIRPVRIFRKGIIIPGRSTN